VIRIRIAVVIVEQGRVLLVRHEKDGYSYWLIPGGGVEFGEEIEATARREIQEETNLEVRIDRLLFVSETLAPDGSRHLLHLAFLGHWEGGELRAGVDDRLKEARYFTADEVLGLDLRPPVHRQLAEGIRSDFAQPPQFLGALWVPEHSGQFTSG
jgi:8-oxo-dGTP diphosphatase